MSTFTDLACVPSDHPVRFTDQLRLAVAAYLARFTGPSREHTDPLGVTARFCRDEVRQDRG